MWTEGPAAASLQGAVALTESTHTQTAGRDWIQIRCLREAERHRNEGLLGDCCRADPSLPAAARVYTAAGQTERMALR